MLLKAARSLKPLVKLGFLLLATHLSKIVICAGSNSNKDSTGSRLGQLPIEHKLFNGLNKLSLSR